MELKQNYSNTDLNKEIKVLNEKINDQKETIDKYST